MAARRRILVVGFDGMRPDLVDAEQMPTLAGHGDGAHGARCASVDAQLRLALRSARLRHGARPDFRDGAVSTLRSGGIDLAPTILTPLGIEVPASMDGRVLWKAFS